MNEIEFLPKRFREKQRSSKIQVSRWFVLSLLVGAMGIVSLFQFLSLHHAHVQLASLQVQHARVAELLQEVELARDEATRKRHHARLLTFLDHPYPKSQIIAEVVNPLSTDIVIMRLELTEIQAAATGTRPVSEQESDKAAQGHPMESDLKALVSEAQTRKCVVEIEGTTSDSASLYTFLAALHESEVIQSAKIESIDPQVTSDGQEISNFTAHVNLERGHFDDFRAILVSTLGMSNLPGGTP